MITAAGVGLLVLGARVDLIAAARVGFLVFGTGVDLIVGARVCFFVLGAEVGLVTLLAVGTDVDFLAAYTVINNYKYLL